MGIDEAFLDVTGRVKDYNEVEALAQKIKQEIKAKQTLTCSIGVGPNKLFAKVASDFQKPDGLIIVREEDSKKFLDSLPVRKLLWVGRTTEIKLKALKPKHNRRLGTLRPHSVKINDRHHGFADVSTG